MNIIGHGIDIVHVIGSKNLWHHWGSVLNDNTSRRRNSMLLGSVLTAFSILPAVLLPKKRFSKRFHKDIY